jgi:voltage-gated potassium channel Kch
MLALVAGSVLVFRQAMALSFIDAFYFIVTTVTTTGYGDISPKDAGVAVKLYACLVMVLGSALTAVLFSIVTDFVVKARVREALSGRRRRTGGHVIVAGLGNLGLRTVEALRREGTVVVAVEKDGNSEFVESVKGTAEVVVGDARLPEVLARAGVAEASAIVCATGDDAANLGTALAAREAAPGVRTAVRLFDAAFAAKAREAFGLDAAMSASLRAAPLFVGAVLEEGVLAAFVEEDARLIIVRRAPARPWQGVPPRGVPERVAFRAPGPDGPFRPASDEEPLRGDEALVLVSCRSLAPR